MAVTKDFALEIDTELSNLYNDEWRILDKIAYYKETLDFYIKNPKYASDNVEHYEKEIEILKQKLVPIRRRQKELDAIYDQDPWTRAYLVVSSDGHVHSTRDCSTCFPQTRYAWLIQYSNDDEKTIVEDAGQDACTVCYPSAPAEVLNRPSRIVTADKIAKAQAKAERDAKKAERIAKEKANAPTASGEFLTYKEGKYTRVIKTERSAVTEWFNLQWTIEREIVTHYYNGEAHSAESIQKQKDEIAFAQEIADLIARNLAEKHGVSFDQQLKILNNKYQKRRAS
jgi:hypothetical protein